MNDTLNIYSLLIPCLVLCLSLITVLIAYQKKLGHYVLSYALALFLMGITMLLSSSLSSQWLTNFASILAIIYFSACICHSKALYARLKIPFSWQRCFSVMLLGTSGVYLFSHVYLDESLRILMVAIATTLIYLHLPRLFLAAKTRFKIDTYLKQCTYLMLGIVLLRSAFILSIPLDNTYITHHAWLWAVTQFLIILIHLVFFSLFMASSIAESMNKLKQEHSLDPLTGLLNRRGFRLHVSQLKAPRTQQHAILMADLDYFKKINDQYGHHLGDLALQHVSRLLQNNIRHQDKISRIGGEEFVILLEDLEQQEAYTIAERIRHSIAHTPIRYQGQTIGLSISIGMTFFSNANQVDAALLDADQLLYDAKKMGRNQVQYSGVNYLHEAG